MSVFERIEKPRVVVGAICALVLAIAAILFVRKTGESPEQSGIAGNRAWFSVDDGKTWFADDVSKVPPFVKDGKQAVRAYVYRSRDGKEFVSHLERYSTEGKRAVEARAADNSLYEPARLSDTAIEIKKPGQGNWISNKDPRAAEIRRVLAPDRTTDGVLPVYP
jgi:hypothetical protein